MQLPSGSIYSGSRLAATERIDDRLLRWLCIARKKRKVSADNAERQVDPETADASSARSPGCRGKKRFALKQNRSKDFRIGESVEVEEPVRMAEHGVEARDRGLDETLIDTFPCSDALSSIPNPAVERRIRA